MTNNTLAKEICKASRPPKLGDFFKQRVFMHIQEENVIEMCVKITVGAVTLKYCMLLVII